ncbi:MAG: hypothetical protein VX624_13225, partial [Pseudomonadota bacterium]|nr:hypothetical protein [Pseudomonadota bacterium]
NRFTDELFSQVHLLHRRQHFVDPLARRSFALHAELDTAIDIDWGYRRVETLGAAACPRRDLSRLQSAAAPGWLGENAAVYGQFGTPETTAQITPDLFTQAMITASGAALIEGAVDGTSSMVATRPAFWSTETPWRLTRCSSLLGLGSFWPTSGYRCRASTD